MDSRARAICAGRYCFCSKRAASRAKYVNTPSAPARLNASNASIITASRGIADYFVAAAQAFGGEAKLVANWVMGSVAAKLNEAGQDIADSPVNPAQLAGLLLHAPPGPAHGLAGPRRALARQPLAHLLGLVRGARALVL